jgi:hypothetical protein
MVTELFVFAIERRRVTRNDRHPIVDPSDTEIDGPSSVASLSTTLHHSPFTPTVSQPPLHLNAHHFTYTSSLQLLIASRSHPWPCLPRNLGSGQPQHSAWTSRDRSRRARRTACLTARRWTRPRLHSWPLAQSLTRLVTPSHVGCLGGWI